MIAVTDKKDYFKGNHFTYNLKTLIGKAGGNPAHYNLYQHLFSYSFDKEYFDQRAGTSILFILPSLIRIPLAILLYQRELEIANMYAGLNSIKDPLELMRLATSITEEPLGNVIASKLNEKDYSFFESIYQYPQGYLQSGFNTKIKEILSAHNSTSEFSEDIVSLITTNNRRQSSLLIANVLSYSQSIKNELLGLTDQWLHQNI